MHEYVNEGQVEIMRNYVPDKSVDTETGQKGDFSGDCAGGVESGNSVTGGTACSCCCTVDDALFALAPSAGPWKCGARREEVGLEIGDTNRNNGPDEQDEEGGDADGTNL